MSAVVTRDALADALYGLLAWQPGPGETLDSYSRRMADALLSGYQHLFVDAEMLAEDDALTDRVATDLLADVKGPALEASDVAWVLRGVAAFLASPDRRKAIEIVPKLQWEACGRGICARENGHDGRCDY